MNNRNIPPVHPRVAPEVIQGEPPVTTSYHRLSTVAYQQLERSLPHPTVRADTGGIQTGYLLGVQAVLKALRDGFVVAA